jgi:hypothetical protein
MIQPVLLVRIGPGGLSLAARWERRRSKGNGASTLLQQHDEAIVLEPAETPGDFLKRHLECELAREFGRSWDELHPAHQKIVTKERYSRCRAELYNRTGVSAELASFVVLEVEDKLIHHAEIPQTTAKAVTVEFVLRGGGRTQSVVDTLHAIQVEHRWVWILRDEALRAYEAGSSPGVAVT